jgi:hypothetical protein
MLLFIISRILKLQLGLECSGPITVAAQSLVWTVFVRSNTGVMGSNPTRSMDVCIYSLFALF